jgi:hypothetical protein
MRAAKNYQPHLPLYITLRSAMKKWRQAPGKHPPMPGKIRKSAGSALHRPENREHAQH